MMLIGKPASESLLPPQMSHGLTKDLTQNSVMRGQQLND